MPTLTKNYIHKRQQFGGKPYGMSDEYILDFELNATGTLLDYEPATIPAPADIIRLMEMPTGAQIIDAQLIVSDACTEAATLAIGHDYIDGTDNAALPEGATTIFAATALDSAARTRMTAVLEVVPLPEDAYIIATLGGVQVASACKAQLVLTVKRKGDA